jgi:CRISPR-associated endonuclease/helicase Cas3
LLAGFRHELNSLVQARKETSCEPVLHLVGSHHGWARPNWEARAYDRGDPRESESAALEAARRFGEMQAEWGHWGLAYLEAILKAADGLASEEAENA